MDRKEPRPGLAIALAASLAGLLAPAPAAAVEVVITDAVSATVVSDNGRHDENPALGVIDISLWVTNGGIDVENYRCQVEVGEFQGRAQVLPITGSEVRVVNYFDDPWPVDIECRHDLGFEIWGPGGIEERVRGEAEDPFGGTLDIIELDTFFGYILPAGSIPAAGPCPEGGGPQPCAFDFVVFGDAFTPIFIGDSVSVPLEIEIGGYDEVRFTLAEWWVTGSPKVPVLDGGGTAGLVALLLAAERSAGGSRTSIASSRPLS